MNWIPRIRSKRSPKVLSHMLPLFDYGADRPYASWSKAHQFDVNIADSLMIYARSCVYCALFLMPMYVIQWYFYGLIQAHLYRSSPYSNQSSILTLPPFSSGCHWFPTVSWTSSHHLSSPLTLTQSFSYCHPEYPQVNSRLFPGLLRISSCQRLNISIHRVRR